MGLKQRRKRNKRMQEHWAKFQALVKEKGFILLGVTTPFPGDSAFQPGNRLLILGLPYQDAPVASPPELHISTYYFWENKAFWAGRELLDTMAEMDKSFHRYAGRNAKAYARRAGAGFFGRNDLLQRQDIGSRFILQLFSTELPFPITGEHEDIRTLAPSCAHCGQCVAVCPVGALDGSGRLDRSKCLRAWMFQARETVPEPLREAMENRLLGCEDCQRACPQNQALAVQPLDPLEPFRSLSYWLCDEALFRQRYHQLSHLLGCNLVRSLRLRCQLTLLMGNLGGVECVDTLSRWAEKDEEILREYAVWALARVMERE